MIEEEKKEKFKLKKLLIFIPLALVLLIGTSYAWFLLTLNGTKTNVLQVGTLSVVLDDASSNEINLPQTIPTKDSVGLASDPYTFTLENNGTVPSEFTLYLDDATLQSGETRLSDSYIKYDFKRNGTTLASRFLSQAGANPTRVLDKGVINNGDKYTYDLRMWLDYDTTTAQAAGKTFRGKIRVEANQIVERVKYDYNNENIVGVYAYETTDTYTKCITGLEYTCQSISPDVTTYEAGTIVEYKVNDEETRFFYVLHDDGDKLTMQQRENTLEETKWYSSNSNAYGPTVALAGLEEETADWNNVLDQTYTMGTTVLGTADNAFTGCSAYNTCAANTYILAERTAKARMITLQEAAAVGCTGTSKSCPIWMYNYLSKSTSYGGTANAGSEDYYWTMTAYSSNSSSAWSVFYNGNVFLLDASYYANAVRAVVQISK